VRIEVELDCTEARPLGTLRGEVKLRGGKEDQQLQNLKLCLTVDARIDALLPVRDDHLVILEYDFVEKLEVPAQTEQAMAFEVALPGDIPVSLAETKVYAEIRCHHPHVLERTVIDIKAPESYQRLISCMAQVGLKLKGAFCQESSVFEASRPLAQFFEFDAQGTEFSEVEAAFRLQGTRIDVFLVADRKRSGFLGWIDDILGHDSMVARTSVAVSDSDDAIIRAIERALRALSQN
jgi:sporulation-control protein spo0M